MRKRENELMARLFDQMNDKDRQWFLSTAKDTVQQHPTRTAPDLKLVVGGEPRRS